jgi:class 3 adenylate cyclase
MHSLKIGILKSFGLFVASLGRLCLVGAIMVIAAQGLGFIDHVEQYTFLRNFINVEHFVEAPVVSLLHANVPCVFGGLDLAPFALGLVLIIVWILCETELHRLRVSTWTLAEEKKIAAKKRAEARELKKLEKERVERNRQRAKEEALAEKQAALAAKQAQKQAALAGKKEALKPAPAPSAPSPAPSPAPAPAPALAAAPAVEGETQREKLLELYAQTKKSLEEQKKNLSFLAVDVVNSTGMKLGEDQALAERDFRQYKKLVERIITAHKGLKAAWTPDGVMICFASVQNAVQAAQELIRGLEHFNRSVKAIKADFKVRCGINAGNVLFDESVRMEEMTDRHIDIAGHMQKYADPNTIYVGAHAIESIRAQFDFHNAEKKVDGHDVYAWRDDTAGAV